MWSLNVLVVVSLAALCAADSEENLTASSIELTADNFDKEIDGKNVLVTFYSPRYVSRHPNLFSENPIIVYHKIENDFMIVT